MKPLKLLLFVLCCMVNGNCALINLMNGVSEFHSIADTLDIYDSLEPCISIKNEEGFPSIEKAKIFSIILNQGTIYFSGNAANRSDSSKYFVDFKSKEEYSIDEIKDKIASYSALKYRGSRMLKGGGYALLIGAGLFGCSFIPFGKHETEGQAIVQTILGASGVLLILVDIPIAMTGLVLYGTGKSKETEYMKRLRRADPSLFNGPNNRTDEVIIIR